MQYKETQIRKTTITTPRYQASERRSRLILRIYRSACRRKPARDRQAYLTMRIKEIASVQVRYGYRRIHVLLKREG